MSIASILFFRRALTHDVRIAPSNMRKEFVAYGEEITMEKKDVLAIVAAILATRDINLHGGSSTELLIPMSLLQ